MSSPAKNLQAYLNKLNLTMNDKNALLRKYSKEQTPSKLMWIKKWAKNVNRLRNQQAEQRKRLQAYLNKLNRRM